MLNFGPRQDVTFHILLHRLSRFYKKKKIVSRKNCHFMQNFYISYQGIKKMTMAPPPCLRSLSTHRLRPSIKKNVSGQTLIVRKNDGEFSFRFAQCSLLSANQVYLRRINDDTFPFHSNFLHRQPFPSVLPPCSPDEMSAFLPFLTTDSAHFAIKSKQLSPKASSEKRMEAPAF
jgi:hypothetical protein